MAIITETKICCIDGCNKKSRSRGLCESHYKRLLKYGDPLHMERIGRKQFNECVDCGSKSKKIIGKGLCTTCYYRWYRWNKKRSVING